LTSSAGIRKASSTNAVRMRCLSTRQFPAAASAGRLDTVPKRRSRPAYSASAASSSAVPNSGHRQSVKTSSE
jgi:hypothetical protein